MDFAGLVVLIVGASSDIGGTLASILNDYGATVIGTFNNNKIDELYDTYKCDITSEKEVKELFDYIKDKHEKLDVVVNCAALTMDNDIYDKSKDEFMRVIEVNLGGTFLINKYASLIMDRGVIVNMSSTDASTTYNVYEVDYASSKAGVETLTKIMAQRLPFLKVCALAPNYVDTESVRKMDQEFLKSELKRIGQDKLLTKEEVALKIIEIIINDDIISGEIVKLGDNFEK